MLVSPSKPSWFDQELTNFRGTQDGKPVLRVVFGLEAKDHNGRYRYLSPHGGPFKCWILERYAPSVCAMGLDRDEWRERRYFFDDHHGRYVDLLGDYPGGNDGYIMICPLTTRGEFIPLSQQVLSFIKFRVWRDEKFSSLDQWTREHLVADTEAKREAQKAQKHLDRENEIDEHYKVNWGKINRKQNAGFSFTPR